MDSKHGRTGFGWPERNYIDQICVDAGYSLEDQPAAIDDKD